MIDKNLRNPLKYFFPLLFFFFFSTIVYSATSMGNYCYTPPFVLTSVDPNVLFILDNSGSMNEFAYHEVRGYRCSHTLTWTGFDESKKYYGIFNPDKCYKYDNSKHYFYESGNVVDDPSTDITERAACLASSCSVRCFSGNWLNWWTMRRTDISKKVLTGGKNINESGEFVLLGTSFDRDTRRIYSDYASSDSPTDGNITPSNKKVYYTPFRRAFYSYFFTASRNGTTVPAFNVEVAKFNKTTDFTGSTCVDVYINASPDGDSHLPDDSLYANVGENLSYPAYFVAVKSPTAPTGLIQNIKDKMRIGYMHFNFDEGGKMVNFVGDDANTIIDNINNEIGNAWTPLTETLYEAMRYFKQQSPYYFSSDFHVNNTWDPFYFNDISSKVRCVKSFIVYVTDGEPTKDSHFPTSSVNANFQGDGTGYMDDIAYKIHTEDLRSDIFGDQTISIYTVFAFDESQNAKNLLKRVARAGGFTDLDGNGKPYCDKNCATNWGNNFYPGSCEDGTSSCNPNCKEWDADCNGVPDNYYEASDGYKLADALNEVFADISKQPSSGTALGVSYSVNKVNRADGIIQAIFYPERIFTDGSKSFTVKWTGELYKYSPRRFDKGFEKWKAGENLKDKTPLDRIIYVRNGSSLSQIKRGIIKSKACGTDSACESHIDDIIDFIKGYQINNMRNITVDNSGHTWKLGDIVYSTPHVEYSKNNGRSYIYVGANDGMLHVFDYDNGEEQWAFIPDSALPYLKYLYEPDYCHLYLVDAEAYIYKIYDTDSSGNLNFDSVKRKILIGGMGFGGGCGCSGTSNCVNPPSETCSSPTGSGCKGKSSYFALDVTNPQNPLFLWEFKHKYLGLAWSGPAFVRRKEVSSGNWKYFVSFVSGPTTPDGYSTQKLRIFTLDLLSGTLLKTKAFSSLNNAFGGRLYNEGLDVNEDNQTDFFFVGYNKKTGSATAHGGIIKVWTGDSNPVNWNYDTTMFNLAQNPIVAKVSSMKCFGVPYIYFGTGRFFYPGDDDQDINYLYGLPFPCDENNNCTVGTINSAYAAGSTVACEDIGKYKANKGGWKVQLSSGSSGSLKERCYSDPLPVANKNIVYYFTAIPKSDICAYGGDSKVYGLNCATGENIEQGICHNYRTVASKRSKLLLPTTTSNIYSIPPAIKPKDTSDSKFHSGTPQYYQLPGLPPPGGGGFFVPEVNSKVLLWLER